MTTKSMPTSSGPTPGRHDPLLSKVIHATGQGWGLLRDADPELYSYKARQNELSVENGCLLWGCRVVIPPNLHTKILDQFHDLVIQALQD